MLDLFVEDMACQPFHKSSSLVFEFSTAAGCLIPVTRLGLISSFSGLGKKLPFPIIDDELFAMVLFCLGRD